MRLIDADAAIDAIESKTYRHTYLDQIVGIIKDLPTIQPKTGKWIEQTVIENAKAAGIEEVQYARCSVCGLYHTTPYMYYFSNYNFCPHCGARMVDGDE